jgi:hypothetical protein
MFFFENNGSERRTTTREGVTIGVQKHSTRIFEGIYFDGGGFSFSF